MKRAGCPVGVARPEAHRRGKGAAARVPRPASGDCVAVPSDPRELRLGTLRDAPEQLQDLLLLLLGADGGEVAAREGLAVVLGLIEEGAKLSGLEASTRAREKAASAQQAINTRTEGRVT